jgi:ATP-dependent Clp protease ATP-binding subunit ClpC
MELFINGKLNPEAFELDVRHATHDLSDALLAAVNTQSAAIESTHFLMVVAKVPGGVTRKKLMRFGLTPDVWERELGACAIKSKGGAPLAHLTESSLHDSARAMLKTAQELCAQYDFIRITETILLLAGLKHATEGALKLFKDIDLDSWIEELEQSLRKVEPVKVFKKGEVDLDKFTPGAKKVLSLARGETESLGYEKADPRHLLLALLEREGGVTQYGLYHQGLAPKKIQEAAMLTLRARAKRTRSVAPLDKEHLQPMLSGILEEAGELAGRDHVQRVTEPHLLRAFLSIESSARRILEDEKVDLVRLREIAEGYDTSGDEEDEGAMADIETVRKRLLQRLVGQDDAIERILPYIQRMRFGFTTPGRPVGVFLFCGQSGSGKTEMAKELARAVYGSEENLIFLEMGQFNSPESMNIFVGAPPGYIGYGEGKLTNGLRDKPRAVVLFDEVEKAHAKVLDALLRFLDEGRIDDPAGPVRDGSECIVILTSNVGAEALSQLWKQVENNPNWRTVVRKKLREEFKKHNFRVEFLNRVDELILFHTLGVDDYTEIAERLLERNLERLRKERDITVEPDPSVAKAIGSYCAEISEGARAAARLTQSVVITPVIDFILKNNCSPPIRLKVEAARATNDPDCEPSGKVWLA